MMRRILVNYARDRAAAKRGGNARRVSLSLAEDALQQADVDTIVLHEALERLEQLDRRKGRVVELKYFGGLTNDEIADVLGISGATVEREWKFARAWLYDAIEGTA
jgi:RNA polymerase sigma factor (TIGR02999 family)